MLTDTADIIKIKLFIVVCLVAQSCPTLCDPMNCNPQDFSAHGIFQARTLCGLFPSLGDPSHPGIKPASSALAG